MERGLIVDNVARALFVILSGLVIEIGLELVAVLAEMLFELLLGAEFVLDIGVIAVVVESSHCGRSLDRSCFCSRCLCLYRGRSPDCRFRDISRRGLLSIDIIAVRDVEITLDIAVFRSESDCIADQILIKRIVVVLVIEAFIGIGIVVEVDSELLFGIEPYSIGLFAGGHLLRSGTDIRQRSSGGYLSIRAAESIEGSAYHSISAGGQKVILRIAERQRFASNAFMSIEADIAAQVFGSDIAFLSGDVEKVEILRQSYQCDRSCIAEIGAFLSGYRIC